METIPINPNQDIHSLVASESTTSKDPYILLVSGLEIGDISTEMTSTLTSEIEQDLSLRLLADEYGDYQLACQLLIDFLSGRYESESILQLASQVTRYV